EFIKEHPYFVGRIERIEEPDVRTPEIEARFHNLRAQAGEVLQLLPHVPRELVEAIQAAASPSALTDLVAAYMDVSLDEKQQILETVDLPARMDKVARLLGHRIEVLRLSEQIGKQTKAAL